MDISAVDRLASIANTISLMHFFGQFMFYADDAS